MKYNIFIRKNLSTISITLAILVLVFYLFTSYRKSYTTPFGYIENLSSSGGEGNCTQDGIDSYATGKHLQCCQGTNEYLKKWNPNDIMRYKCCVPSSGGGDCTPEGGDPYYQPATKTKNHLECCPGTKETLGQWDGTGKWYYQCKSSKPSNPCDKVNCGDHGNCDNGKCICSDNYTGLNCETPPSGKCYPPCTGGQVCQSGTCVTQGGGNSPNIVSQPNSSIQIVNNTSDTPLHVFLQLKNTKWEKIDGNGTIYPAIYWGKDAIAWNPLGALNLSEAIIPKNGYIILKIPPDMHGLPFRVAPLKFKNNDNTPLSVNEKQCGSTLCKLLKQWPILLEGGEDVVADSSAVDGVNYKMKYELTSDNNTIKVMEINKNPCEGLDPKYQLEVGCRNPALVDCNGPTCECKPASQNCMFNSCSQKLFNIPNNLKQYIGNYDGGGGPVPPSFNNYNKYPDYVKKFINNSNNLYDGSPLKQFCNNLQYNHGDFTAYCYDYNDVSSSPWLRAPYKMKVTYTDL